MNEIKIHDIKPLVTVVDHSLYIYYGLIVLGFLIVCAVLYFIYGFFKNKKQNIRKEYFNILENVDFTNSKLTAYTITKYGYLLAKNDREKQLLSDLILKLDRYKYKKSVPSFDEDTKASYNIFMDSLDV